MTHPSIARVALFVVAILVTTTAPSVAADANRAAFVETIDLSPGPDPQSPEWLALNRTTGRLFVGGAGAVAVIDIGKRAVIGGIPLGRYATSSTDFKIIDMAVDEGPGPAGNKLYVLGSASNTLTVLRIIDAQTNANLTAEGTDILLPATTTDEKYTMLAVNRANQKAYVATSRGRIVVVDGVSARVLKTLDAGASGSLVVNPVGNKVFMLGGGRSAVIDSNTDSLTSLPLVVQFALSPVYNEQNGRVYFTGRVDTRDAIFALNGMTGQLLAESSSSLPYAKALAVAPDLQRVYTSQSDMRINVLDATSLALIETMPYSAMEMIYGPPGGPLIIRDPFGGTTGDLVRNGVGLVDPATKALDRIIVSYAPVELALNPETRRLYVADAVAAELLALDSDNAVIVDRIDVPRPNASALVGVTMRGLAVSTRFNCVLVPRTSGVEVFDATSHQLRREIRLSFLDVPRVAVDDRLGQFYLTGFRSETGSERENLLYIFAGDGELLDTVSLGSTYGVGVRAFDDLAVNPATGKVYVFGAGSIFHIIDGASRQVVTAVDLRQPSGQLAIDTKRNTVYVARSESRPPGGSEERVLALDGDTGAIIKSIALPDLGRNRVKGMAFDPIAGTLYVAHADVGTLSGGIIAFDVTADHRIQGRVDLPNAGRLLFDHDTRRLYVPDARNGTVRVLRPDDWRLLGNISTRGRAGVGDQVLIGGFIVGGPAGSTKKVIVRALGPSLSAVGVPGALTDTTLELHDSEGRVIENDDWKIDAATKTSQQSAIEATGIPPLSDAESALTATLAPGPCTVIVSGKDGTSGAALVEVYDLDQSGAARLANISTRGFVGRGDEAMIGGVIVLGLHPSRVLVRAIGPSLTNVPGALQDPMLELRDGNGGLIDVSDDWKSGRESEIAATTIPPSDDRESALVATLYPGNYTAVVRGKDATTGVALVEAYHLD
ncbi:MAG: hypothetical protein AVDCRST_MAG42-1089 [uncultured Chthoniobacterales bacterium]|uniref:Uncharacterized protein n=1 Tax=uncultured Chthoniobacterales bacterium TaxID=1836801 RepID=A0A6J4HRZ7_9BACT|nr:MAG: hypothetical protein AVDCRST_MAG42-1089 [uncultured Chthoniobacterales bacterium]